MSNNVEKFNQATHLRVIKAYLYDGISHRAIQEEILNVPAPARGGGFLAMEILHYYGIMGDKKGVLKHKSLSEEEKNSSGMYKLALDMVKQHL